MPSKYLNWVVFRHPGYNWGSLEVSVRSRGVKIPNQRQTEFLFMMKMIVTKDEEYAGQHPDLNGSQALRLQMHTE